MRFLLALLLLSAAARAQQGAPSQCGPVSVGTAAVSVTFPASGQHGPGGPQRYLTIYNPSATATIWVNALPGGTAAANTAGSIGIAPGGSVTWYNPQYPPPAGLSIIASGATTAVTCAYQ